MNKFPVIEKFVSIDGEGPTAGALATFIRFEGCNLRCKWCDTTYSFDGSSEITYLSALEIYEFIKASGIRQVTLTGGEPLMQPHISELLELLAKDHTLLVHIETNGAVAIEPFKKAYSSEMIRYIVDYKLPSSGMSKRMVLENFKEVTKEDTYKFVIASRRDLEEAYRLIEMYNLRERTRVYLSPVSEYIDPADIVEFMKEHKLNDVRLQLQLHKIIWPKESRGV